MMLLKSKIIHRIAVMLDLTNELSAEEKFNRLVKEQEHLTLLDRIKAIRTTGYYEPVYDKPKLYSDVVIGYNSSEGFVPITNNTITSCPRPIDFGNNIRAWKKSVRIDHKKATKEKQEAKASEEARRKELEEQEAIQKLEDLRIRKEKISKAKQWFESLSEEEKEYTELINNDIVWNCLTPKSLASPYN